MPVPSSGVIHGLQSQSRPQGNEGFDLVQKDIAQSPQIESIVLEPHPTKCDCQSNRENAIFETRMGEENSNSFQHSTVQYSSQADSVDLKKAPSVVKTNNNVPTLSTMDMSGKCLSHEAVSNHIHRSKRSKEGASSPRLDNIHPKKFWSYASAIEADGKDVSRGLDSAQESSPSARSNRSLISEVCDSRLTYRPYSGDDAEELLRPTPCVADSTVHVLSPARSAHKTLTISPQSSHSSLEEMLCDQNEPFRCSYIEGNSATSLVTPVETSSKPCKKYLSCTPADVVPRDAATCPGGRLTPSKRDAVPAAMSPLNLCRQDVSTGEIGDGAALEHLKDEDVRPNAGSLPTIGAIHTGDNFDVPDSTVTQYAADADEKSLPFDITCVVCGEAASGNFFGAIVCLPCKSFFIRCTKDNDIQIVRQCRGQCDVNKQLRNRCQFCRFQRCIEAGMSRKEKPESIQVIEGQELCRVCGDLSNGIHFGVFTCEGCKKFFRRGLKEHPTYVCKEQGTCRLTPRNRNSCRRCRYRKCIIVGMSRTAIKMGRPRKLFTSWEPAAISTVSGEVCSPLQEGNRLASWKNDCQSPNLYATEEICLKDTYNLENGLRHGCVTRNDYISWEYHETNRGHLPSDAKTHHGDYAVNSFNEPSNPFPMCRDLEIGQYARTLSDWTSHDLSRHHQIYHENSRLHFPGAENSRLTKQIIHRSSSYVKNATPIGQNVVAKPSSWTTRQQYTSKLDKFYNSSNGAYASDSNNLYNGSFNNTNRAHLGANNRPRFPNKNYSITNSNFAFANKNGNDILSDTIHEMDTKYSAANLKHGECFVAQSSGHLAPSHNTKAIRYHTSIATNWRCTNPIQSMTDSRSQGQEHTQSSKMYVKPEPKGENFLTESFRFKDQLQISENSQNIKRDDNLWVSPSNCKLENPQPMFQSLNTATRIGANQPAGDFKPMPKLVYVGSQSQPLTTFTNPLAQHTHQQQMITNASIKREPDILFGEYRERKDSVKTPTQTPPISSNIVFSTKYAEDKRSFSVQSSALDLRTSTASHPADSPGCSHAAVSQSRKRTVSHSSDDPPSKKSQLVETDLLNDVRSSQNNLTTDSQTLCSAGQVKKECTRVNGKGTCYSFWDDKKENVIGQTCIISPLMELTKEKHRSSFDPYRNEKIFHQINAVFAFDELTTQKTNMTHPEREAIFKQGFNYSPHEEAHYWRVMAKVTQRSEQYQPPGSSVAEGAKLSLQQKTRLGQLVRAYARQLETCDEGLHPPAIDTNEYDIWPSRGQDFDHWCHLQERISRQAFAETEFVLLLAETEDMLPPNLVKLTDYSRLFGNTLLMASREWFDPVRKKFRFFWNWRFSDDHPLAPFRNHVASLGRRIFNLHMDASEVAILSALNIASPYSTDLDHRRLCLNYSSTLVKLLNRYLYSVNISPIERIPELLSVMAPLRHMSLWYSSLIKNLKADPESSHRTLHNRCQMACKTSARESLNERSL